VPRIPKRESRRPTKRLALTDEPLWRVSRLMAETMAGLPVGGVIEVETLDPDRGRGLFAGERIVIDDIAWRARSYRTWQDLAETLDLRALTPRSAPPPRVLLRFERLDVATEWRDPGTAPQEKYGAASTYARIDKFEEPWFLISFEKALARVGLGPDDRVLDLGANRGDALACLRRLAPAGRLTYHGVDHSPSAAAAARSRFEGTGCAFHCVDLAATPSLDLGRFDLVLCLDVLQSPQVDDQWLLSWLVNEALAPNGAIILSLPLGDYVDGETRFGRPLRGFEEPELSLPVKDAARFRRYLQKKGFRVETTGKQTLLLTARRAGLPWR